MKQIFKISFIFIFFLGLWSCVEDENKVSSFNAPDPTNISAAFRVEQDNSGLVTISPLGEGATNFRIDNFGDDSDPSELIPIGGNVQHTYAEGTYDVTVTGIGLDGTEVSATLPLVISFIPPTNLNVMIENDAAVSKQVNVTVTADNAVSYEVDFGESDSGDNVSANIGETASFQYQEAGTYTITVVVMGAAIETTTYTQEFEVTEIMAPVASAANPPFRQSEDVISFFSGAYENIGGVNFNPDWGQATQYSLYDLNGDEILQYATLNYQGIDFESTPVNVSEMEYLHVDVWTAGEEDAKIFLISPGPNETAYDLDLTAQEWASFDIPLSFFTDANPAIDLTNIIQFKLEGNPSGGTIFVDNLYVWRMPQQAPTVLGTWQVSPTAGSLRVGPTPGSGDWWSIDDAGVEQRACFYNDQYKFHTDGTFENILGADTWVEGWQGASEDACGAPVAPHDGMTSSTFTYDAVAGNVTLVGSGAYLGIPKAVNEGELPNVPVPASVTYSVTLNDANNMTVIVEAGSGVFWTFEMVKVEGPGTPLDGSWSMSPVAGSMRVGPEPGSGDWWGIDDAGVAQRACFYDDEYIFSPDGSFTNFLGDETWLEGWQGVEADACGAGVAPHDGSTTATYFYDEDTGTVTLNGAGAYLGIPKANNQGELPNVDVPNSIAYNVTFVDDNHITLVVEAGAGVFWTFEMTKN